MNNYKKVSARNMHFKLQESDINEKTLDSLKSFVEQKKCHVLMTKNGDLLLCCDKKIQMKYGERTLQCWLGTQHLPIRVQDFSPLPNGFFWHYFAEGYDAEKVFYKTGQTFDEKSINQLVQEKIERTTFKKHNEEILKSDACDLVKRGTIHMNQLKQTEENKNLFAKLESKKILNPDLDKEYNIIFQHRVNGELANDYPPVAVTLEAQPCQKKKKHYYIYSHNAGFGKTYEMCQFAEKYNAHVITDSNNWIDVPDEAQFLIFDELGKLNKLNFEHLKSLTGGYGMMSGNCKSYGSSFRPRKDVQVIITSNQSPYEIYGEWDNNSQRRIMSADAFSQFQDRFHVIRLDGDILEDEIKYLEPTVLTDAQFRKACIKQLVTDLGINHLGIQDPNSRTMLLTKKSLMKVYLKTCYFAFKNMYSMWLSRHANTNLVRRSITYMLQELQFGPELVDVAQSYFIHDEEFVKGTLLVNKIDKFLSRTDASYRIKMLVDAVDKEAGVKKKRPLVEDEADILDGNNIHNKKHALENYWPLLPDFTKYNCQRDDENNPTVQGIKNSKGSSNMLVNVVLHHFKSRLEIISDEEARDIEKHIILTHWREEMDNLINNYNPILYRDRDLLYDKVQRMMDMDPVFCLANRSRVEEEESF